MSKIAEPSTAQPLSVPSPAEAEASARPPRTPYVPWLAAVVLGSGATVLLGWAAVGALVVVGWLTATSLPAAAVLDTIAQLWMGAHGASFTVAGMTIGLTPLGLSMLICVAMASVARYAVTQRMLPAPLAPSQAALMVAACTASYSVGVVLLASLVGAPRQAASAFVGAAILSSLGSALGIRRECAPLAWPARLNPALRFVLPGIRAGLLALTGASVLTLALAIFSHLGRIGTLQSSLAPDPVGAVLLVVSYLAYAPDLVAWAGAYSLGAGIQIGEDTLLTPLSSHLGLLPGIPIAGALPTVPPVAGWLLLATGPVSGLIAGMVSVRALAAQGTLPTWRIGAWVGGLAGLGAGLVWAVASWFTRGSLGTGRLSEVGPRFGELWLCATVPLMAAGALAGAAWVVWRARQLRAAGSPAAEPRP